MLSDSSTVRELASRCQVSLYADHEQCWQSVLASVGDVSTFTPWPSGSQRIEMCIGALINLYLLSRIIYALIRLAVKRGYISQPRGPVFPWFAAGVWGVVLWLFEHEADTLQPSLKSSMTYLYHDSNFWSSLRNFLIHNK
ncbi:hypothetical protein C0Q70_05198 [Pomacea canaliculata]|uniref:Uncharacterized protein n=1 Tax=Pomacea canaliculata TaxID=400727 RepID=A0A2T7PKH5_POMCA|nr:hypothetical protein C0Q70_05198 [Pomacea canaliculata]